MRLMIQAFGHTLDLGITPDTEPTDPQPNGSQCGDLSIADDPGEDVRMPSKTYMPLGFVARGRQ